MQRLSDQRGDGIFKIFKSEFPGERHAILKMPNGSLERANFMGPGTHIEKRIKRGDQGKTEVDTISKAHDIRYALAKNLDDIREADNLMIAKVREVAKKKKDSRFNIAQAKLIKAKVAAENLGILDRARFAGDLSEPVDEKLLKSELSNMKGYGGLPGEKLKKKLLKQYSHQMLGEGLSLPGAGKSNIIKFVTKEVIPSLYESLNLENEISDADLRRLIGVTLDNSGQDLKQVVTSLSKALQILTQQSGGKLAQALLKAFKWYINRGAKQQGLKPVFKVKGGDLSYFWKGL